MPGAVSPSSASSQVAVGPGGYAVARILLHRALVSVMASTPAGAGPAGVFLSERENGSIPPISPDPASRPAAVAAASAGPPAGADCRPCAIPGDPACSPPVVTLPDAALRRSLPGPFPVDCHLRDLDRFAKQPDVLERSLDAVERSSMVGHGREPAENGGESGIRTHGTLLTYTRFPSVRLKPLGHLSVPLILQTKSPPRGEL